MRLARGSGPGAFVPLTPLVDVMLILLVFFMVTSTYLDLDMIPAGDTAEQAAAGGTGASGSATMLLRLSAGGSAVWRGRTLGPAALEAAIAAEVARVPGLSVVILPSGAAPVQALVGALEAAARGGAARTRVLRVEGRP